jgi:hypothetical protein
LSRICYLPSGKSLHPSDPGVLRITIYATLIVILRMGVAFAQNDLRDVQGGENSLRNEQTTETLIAPTNQRLKGFRIKKKSNLIRGAMFVQLHQRRRQSTSHNARTYLYGPAVCCKPDVSDGGIGLAHLYPARE